MGLEASACEQQFAVIDFFWDMLGIYRKQDQVIR